MAKILEKEPSSKAQTEVTLRQPPKDVPLMTPMKLSLHLGCSKLCSLIEFIQGAVDTGPLSLVIVDILLHSSVQHMSMLHTTHPMANA